jgi:hypothetical protein
MNSIGIIFLTDIHDIESSVYIYGATSLVDLNTYCETMRQYSSAVLMKIQWCEAAEVSYDRTKAYGTRKTYTFAAPVQEMALMYSGQPGDAFSLYYYASIILRSLEHVKPRRITIPAPLKDVFDMGSVKPIVGAAMSDAYALLTHTSTAFLSGKLINPKQIHPVS